MPVLARISTMQQKERLAGIPGPPYRPGAFYLARNVPQAVSLYRMLSCKENCQLHVRLSALSSQVLAQLLNISYTANDRVDERCAIPTVVRH